MAVGFKKISRALTAGSLLFGGALTASVLVATQTASATTTTVVSVPGGVTVEGVSSDGQYVLYDVGCTSGECVHWLDTQSGTDILIGLDENLRARLSPDGQHAVWEEFWGGAFVDGDPSGLGLSQGTVYEWTPNGASGGTYTQVSPTATAYPGGGLLSEFAFPSISGDGSVIAYAYRLATQSTCCSSGTTIVNQVTNATINIPESDTWFDPTAMSADGSVIGRPTATGEEIDEYSTADGSVIRSLLATRQLALYDLSSNGLYGVGYAYGDPATSGLAYYDFSNNVVQPIPNSGDGGTGCDNLSSIISVSDDGGTVAFGAPSDGIVPTASGQYNGYFAYDPTTGNDVQINTSSVGPSVNNGGICPSLSLTGDGQNAFLVAYSPVSQALLQAPRSRRHNLITSSVVTTTGSSLVQQVSVPAISGLVPTYPGAPVIGATLAGIGQVGVSFAPPTNDGGAPITSYTVTAADSTVPAHGGQTASGLGSPITVTGLTNGDSYSFTVTATNSIGTGPASAASNPSTPEAALSNPSTPTISNLPGPAHYGGGFTATVSTNGDGVTSVTSSTNGVCTASGLGVSYVGVGTCTLTAHVAQGANYTAADGSPQSFIVLGFIIITSSLPSATPGVAYSPVTLQESGAGTSTSPYVTTFKWKKITLPKGLKLSSAGVLSGTPSKKLATGPSSVTVQATETVITLNGKKKVKTLTTVQATIPLTIN